MKSVIDLIRAAPQGIQFDVLIRRSSLLQATRNQMASLVAQSPGLSHVLFIDSDVIFTPQSVLKLIDSGYDVVGGLYPFRELPLTYRLNDAGETESLGEWLSSHLGYPVKHEPILQQSDFIEVTHIATGLLLVSRGALLRMMSSGAVAEYRNDPSAAWYTRPTYHGFFDTVVNEGFALGEDYSFCERWRKTGGKIYALTSEYLGHVGPIPFFGRYQDKLSS